MWTVINALYIGKITDILKYLFVDPLVWFLINLFLLDISLYVCFKFKHKGIIAVLLWMFSLAGYLFFGDKWLVIKNYAMFAPFYFLGFYFCRNKDKFEKIYKCMPVVILYPISMIFYTYKDSSKILIPIQGMLAPYMSEQVLTMVLKIIDKIFITFYNHFIVAPLGICFTWGLVSKFVSKHVFSQVKMGLTFLGKHTMEIYLIHSYVFVYAFTNEINMVLSLLLGCTLPILISYAINRTSPKLAAVLFGANSFEKENVVRKSCHKCMKGEYK